MDNHTQPLVSVLIPLFNQERYFDSCLRSVCCQTYQNLEIIVVNDGSTDNSPDIVKLWAVDDNRIRYVSKDNEGLAIARMESYRLATGEFIAFVDSDDYLPKNAIEVLVGHMVEKGVDLVQGSATRILGFLKQRRYFDTGSFPINRIVQQPELFDQYYLNFFGKSFFPITLWGKLYRKSIIDLAMKKTKLFSIEFPFVGEDHFFNMQLFPFIRSMYRTNETVYYYRYGGASSSKFSPTYPALLDLSDKRLYLLDHFALKDGYKSLFEEYANIVYYHAQQILEFKKGEKDDVINFFKEEMSTREIALRMIAYYSTRGEMNNCIRLMVNRDFEGMYDLANKLLDIRRNSLMQKCKRILLKVTEMFE